MLSLGCCFELTIIVKYVRFLGGKGGFAVNEQRPPMIIGVKSEDPNEYEPGTISHILIQLQGQNSKTPE